MHNTTTEKDHSEMKNKSSRRTFLKQTAAGVAGTALSMNAASYARILGANDRLNFAVVGLNGRGKALMRSSTDVENTMLTHLCDVDSRAVENMQGRVQEVTGSKPKGFGDFRKMLEDKDLDAVAIATPDHWHAPMTLMALKAGKHVYVEKPCCHNPAEGEMLIEASKKYSQVIQMGNQQRSAITSIQAVKDIKDGIIGEVYYGKAWYANNRKSIGVGKSAPVPEWLDWDLWQGPVPKRSYKDNIVHYNWHWFWHWGTGELNNNGTHEIDVCRWALGVDYPTRVSSSGGRYHFKDDDWEFYDTQVANFEFEGGKMITWEGRSCNGHQFFDRGRGATIHGTEGTIMLDRNGYIAMNLKGEVIKEMQEKTKSATTDTVGRGGLDVNHMGNFCDAIRDGAKQNSPIDEGYKSVLLCHLGNISQYLGRSLETSATDGRIQGDMRAMDMWSREYAKDWEKEMTV